MIVLGYPCVGKSYLAKQDDLFVDLESSLYKWQPYEGQGTEEGKSVTFREEIPNWEQGYVEEAIKLSNEGKIVLLAMPPEVQREVTRRLGDYKFIVVAPRPRGYFKKETLIKRAESRGNNKFFVKFINDNFERTILQAAHIKALYIPLLDGEYISDHKDVILRIRKGYLSDELRINSES